MKEYDFEFDESKILRLTFAMDPDIVYETREIYTFWDLLGDVGGLYDMLKLMGQFFVSSVQFFFGSNLYRYLIPHLFKKESSRRRR